MNADEIMKKVICKYHEQELSELPTNEELEKQLTVSPEFVRRMIRLMNKNRRKAKVRKVVRGAAGFFIAAIAGLILLCGINEDIRAECLNFFREMIAGGMTEYQSIPSGNLEEQGEIIGFNIEYVPDGFEIEEDLSEMEEESGASYYMKGDILLCFNYNISDETNFITNNDNVVLKHITLSDGSACDFYKCTKKGDMSLLVWNKGKYICFLAIDNYLEGWEDSELLKVANGIVPIIR